jgi:glycosyltransferase involved in cell wall biosynthesis
MQDEREPVVLATVPFYFPGFKGGGKPVALRNLIGAMRGQFRFKVITANHDLGEQHPYRAVRSNRWIAGDDCETFYFDPHRGALRVMRENLARADYDVLYLNTVFSRPFGIVPLLLRRFGATTRAPIVIAPRGELAAGALAIKWYRKECFLAAARALGLFHGARWQASGEEEARDIRNAVGVDAQITSAPDVLSPESRKWRPASYHKERGRLDILFLSRITPVKNLHLAIEALRGLEGDVTFTIAGPVDDAQYWIRCQQLIASLGTRIRTDYIGPIASSEVSNCLARHGLLLLPTAGESFGYVIFEALAAGCPVLISDQTPWRDLERLGVGWDLSLRRPDLIRAALQRCVGMDADEHRAISHRAREFAVAYMAREDSTASHAAMFRTVLGEHPATRIKGERRSA